MKPSARICPFCKSVVPTQKTNLPDLTVRVAAKLQEFLERHQNHETDIYKSAQELIGFFETHGTR